MTIIKCTLMTIAIACTSCSQDGDIGTIGPLGEQGIQGEQGPAGEDGEALGIPGPQGETGATGATGATGPAGEDGTNGANGEDGNANVSTFTYDLSTESGATIAITATALTQDVVENDLILGYLLKNEDTYTPIPSSIYAFGLNDNSDIAVEIQLNKYWMFFYVVGTENFKSVTIICC